jgi:hypothetical protein
LKSSENSGIDKDLITIISSLAIVMIALVILQIGPKGVKREFEKIK